MKKSIIQLIIFCLITVPFSIVTAQTIQIQGEQTGTLIADTVFLSGNVSIPYGGTLVFLPGTEVIATGFYGFTVTGTLLAQGNIENPVKFSIADTAGFYNTGDSRGGWNGFHIADTPNSADSSIFSYCTFEFGKAVGDSLEKMGGIFNIRDFDKIRISDCIFNHSKAVFWGGAVFAENSDIIIQNCIFNGNFCGTPAPPYGYGGAVCIRHSFVDILNCTFQSNSSTGIGGALSIEYSDVLLNSGVFKNNYSGLGGALGYLRSNPTRPLTGNLFTGNTAQFFGGAISCNKANPHFINNTIAGNSSASYGGGFYCNDSAVPVLINCMIYDNFAFEGPQVYIWDVSSAPEFYYCNIQGGREAFSGTGGIGFNSPYVNNLDTLPGFSGVEPHPFALSDSSPCINAGNPDTTGLMLPVFDLAGNQRIVDGIIDIGAYENISGLTGLVNRNNDIVFNYYPNPFRDEVTFSLPKNQNQKSSLVIIDSKGIEVFRISNLDSDTYTWDCKNLNSSSIVPGIYHVVVTYGNKKGNATIIRSE